MVLTVVLLMILVLILKHAHVIIMEFKIMEKLVLIADEHCVLLVQYLHLLLLVNVEIELMVVPMMDSVLLLLLLLMSTIRLIHGHVHDLTVVLQNHVVEMYLYVVMVG